MFLTYNRTKCCVVKHPLWKYWGFDLASEPKQSLRIRIGSDFNYHPNCPLHHGTGTHHDVASTGSVVSIFQGTHLCLGFVSEVQFHSLYAHVTTPWEEKAGSKDQTQTQKKRMILTITRGTYSTCEVGGQIYAYLSASCLLKLHHDSNL